MRKIYLIVILCLTTLFGYAQGTTTSSLSGKVTDADGEALIGSTVIATHTPTGVVYGSVTDLNGNYTLPNLRVGGPYDVTVSYVGFESTTREGLYLQLGQTQKQNFNLSDGAVSLEAVNVTAARTYAGESNGISTQISSESLATLPSLNNDLNDFTRLTPQAKGSFGGGFSIAGINNRYNAIYIDGAVNNDVFGLAANGTNGGQTGVSPFSVNILDQIQVVISPYDVTLGGFAGGGINAVTKSGTNKWKGDAYFFTQSEGLAAETNTTLTERTSSDREALDEFSNRLYGASLGGPLVKNKVFFFGNVEIQNDETPAPFNLANYDGDSDEADLNALSSFLQSTYGYDPGTPGSKIDRLESTKLFGKVDININDRNNLTLRHQYTRAENTNENSSFDDEINFSGNGVFFPSTTNSSALELNTRISDVASNNLILGYTSVLDDRDPIGGDFPYVIIFDGNGQIELGSEQFSTANQLDQKFFTLTNNFTLYKGKHTWTFGTHNEFINFSNLFIRQNFGVYEYGSVDQFINGENADEFFRSFSLVDNLTGDGSQAAAEFNALQLGFYAQDKIQLSDEFTLTAGLRLDIPVITTDPDEDTFFNSTALPAIEQFYDVQGARSGQLPKAQFLLSPRVGFKYSPSNSDGRLSVRGGVGVFTSRVPFVWPGGSFTNNGLTIGNVFTTDHPFNPDIQTQITNPDFTVPSGQVDLFVEDFKYPQVLRASLGIDNNFENGWFASLEGIYTKTLNNVFYENVNSNPTIDFNWTGSPDDRPVFGRESIVDTYSAVYLGSNTSEGYTYTITGIVGKALKVGINDLNVSLAYTYGNAFSIFEGTSSQNSSQWRGAFTFDGRNNAPLGISDFALGSRLVGNLAYTANWGGSSNFGTTFNLFYEGLSGDPFSYVYNSGGSDARNVNNETGSTSRNRSLIWIPANESEANLIDIVDADGSVTTSAAEQWTALNNFIEEDDYLSENRGAYAERNGGRTPFENRIDLKILQNLGLNLGNNDHKLQVSLDIFNFANLLNSDWGVDFAGPFDYRIVNFEGYAADGTTPQFTFTEDDLGDERFSINDRTSRFRMRLGFRYIFD